MPVSGMAKLREELKEAARSVADGARGGGNGDAATVYEGEGEEVVEAAVEGDSKGGTGGGGEESSAGARRDSLASLLPLQRHPSISPGFREEVPVGERGERILPSAPLLVSFPLALLEWRRGRTVRECPCVGEALVREGTRGALPSPSIPTPAIRGAEEGSGGGGVALSTKDVTCRAEDGIGSLLFSESFPLSFSSVGGAFSVLPCVSPLLDPLFPLPAGGGERNAFAPVRVEE